jgi:hypothetical protein
MGLPNGIRSFVASSLVGIIGLRRVCAVFLIPFIEIFLAWHGKISRRLVAVRLKKGAENKSEFISAKNLSSARWKSRGLSLKPKNMFFTFSAFRTCFGVQNLSGKVLP